MVLRFSPCFLLEQSEDMLLNMGQFEGMLRGACWSVKPLPQRWSALWAERGAEVFFFELCTFVGGQSRTGPAARRQTTLGRVPLGPPLVIWRFRCLVYALGFFIYFLGWGGKLCTVGPQLGPLRHSERVSSFLSSFASLFISPSHTCPSAASMSLLTLPISLLALRSICAPPRSPSAPCL